VSLDSEFTTETTGPLLLVDRNGEPDADPSIQGLNDLRVKWVLLEARRRETSLDDLGPVAPCPHDVKE
jgi:hypothetical protein